MIHSLLARYEHAVGGWRYEPQESGGQICETYVPNSESAAWLDGANADEPDRDACVHHIHLLDQFASVMVVPLCMLCGHVDWARDFYRCSKIDCELPIETSPDHRSSLAAKATASSPLKRTR